MKVENAYQSPVATGNIVWIANPTSGRVAYINARPSPSRPRQQATRRRTSPPSPTRTTTWPSSRTPCRTTPRSSAFTQGQLAPTTTYPSTADANSWAVSPKGRWALAWTNAQFVTNAAPIQGFQDVEVLDLSGQRLPIDLNVGFRPSQVVFSGDETHAYAVTQEGISVLDLTGGTAPAAVALYPLTGAGHRLRRGSRLSGGLGRRRGRQRRPHRRRAVGRRPAGRRTQHDGALLSAPRCDAASGSTGTPDVSFTPNGDYALVRIDGSPPSP